MIRLEPRHRNVGHRTIALGLRRGLIRALADSSAGLTPAELAQRLGLDPFYVAVWCRAGHASAVCDRDTDPGDRLAVLEGPYRLAPHMATLLLDTGHPAYIGGVFTVLEQPEVFDRFEDSLETGERLWWDSCSPDWIAGVADTGLLERCQLVHSPLEEMVLDKPATCVVNNISMHECRDIDRVTANIRAALEPGGWFVISDFPFPDTTDGLRGLPGRVMAGIQYFEAQIGDQLLPRAAYDELLTRHGFTELGHLELSPVHAVTHGRTHDRAA